MNLDFASLDKSDFKCLKTPDGAIYYGQCVQILPPSVETDKLAGFAAREDSKKPKAGEPRGSEASLQAAAQLNGTTSSGGFRLHSSAGIPPTTADPLAALHQEGVEPLVVEDISQVDEELLPKLLTVRHGCGIQIQADKVSKYAGQWHFGARHGDGHLIAPCGSEYRGNLFFGQFHGYGQFVWPKELSDECTSEKQLNHSYQGSWKMGMMHGEGQFNHAEGQVLKPTFVNNLYHLQEGLFVNPFDTETEMRATMDRIAQRKQKESVEERKANERMSVRRVTDIQAYTRTLFEVRAGGRTPLVVSSLQNPLETMDLVVCMGWDLTSMRNIWLRTVAKLHTHALGWLREQRSSHNSYYEECLENMQPWVLNVILDDDEEGSEPWPHHYDPDFDFLFGKAGPGLPETVWEGHKIFASLDSIPPQLEQPLWDHYQSELERAQQEQAEALEKLQQMQAAAKSDRSSRSKHGHGTSSVTNHQSFVQDEANAKSAVLKEMDPKAVMAAHLDEMRHEYSSNLNFTIFSKTKFDENLDDAALIVEAKKRFGISLPLQHIDLVVVQSLEEPSKMEEQPVDNTHMDSVEVASISQGGTTGK